MRIEHFRFCLNQVEAFYLTKEIMCFRKPLELWDEKTGESVRFKSVDQMLSHVIGGRTVKDIILDMESITLPSPNGGRGAGSGGDNKTFMFGHAQDRGKGSNGKRLLPAAANVRIKVKSLESAMEEFQKKFKDSDHEWAYEVDSQGFVHQYVEGGSSSVSIGSSTRDTMILHNHPGGGAFSDSDLLSTSMDRRAKGIVASGRKYDYVFQKGTHFKANEFIKAVKTARMTGKDYDTAVDAWLTKNQRKYGYKYYRKKN